MNKHMLGSGLEVSALGLGCLGSSANDGAVVDREAGIALIQAAVDRSIAFFGTAKMCGPFTNEELSGKHSHRSATTS
jgi:aryl-alcohol dehydrogenase-like predicted oxidoreductase